MDVVEQKMQSTSFTAPTNPIINNIKYRKQNRNENDAVTNAFGVFNGVIVWEDGKF